MRYLSILFFCMLMLLASVSFAQYTTTSIPSGISRMTFTDGIYPNLTYTGNQITQIVSDTTTTNYESNTIDWIGIDSGGNEHRILWKADISWLPPNVVIFDAELRFTTKNDHTSYVDADAVEIFAHRSFKDIALDGATWANYKALTAWGSAGANDVSGTWDDLFGHTGTFTITSQWNDCYLTTWTSRDDIGIFPDQDWSNLPIGTDSLTVASINGGMDRCEYPESYSDVKPYASGAAGTYEWQFRINVRHLVNLWHTMGVENYGAILRVDPNWIINPSGNGGLIGVASHNHTTLTARPTLVVWFYYLDEVTVPDGDGSSGGGSLGNQFQGIK